MEQISLKIDQETSSVLNELQKFYGVRGRPALFKRLIAIGRIAERYADKDKCLYIEKQGAKKKDRIMVIALTK